MISINFASKNYRLIGRIRSGLVFGSAILCIAMAGMIWAALSLRADMASLEHKLKEAVAADEKAMPLLGERERLAKDLTAMSGLMDSRKSSWTRILTSLEAVVPIGVAMTRVEFNSKLRAITLEGLAQSPEALRTLVVGLEKSSSFREPFLKHQSLEKGIISFNVIAVYQDDKGAGVAAGGR